MDRAGEIRDSLKKARKLEKEEKEIESLGQLRKDDAKFRKEAMALGRLINVKGQGKKKKIARLKKSGRKNK